jgi:hypothetical protein
MMRNLSERLLFRRTEWRQDRKDRKEIEEDRGVDCGVWVRKSDGRPLRLIDD